MDNEIYEKAKVIMTQRRTTALSQNEQRIQEINNKIPEIKEINDALYATGKELIRMVIDAKGKDISKQIESIKASNLGAQDMSKHILAAHGYPADYLDVHFTCPKCCDTGSDGTKMCSCMKQLCGKLMADELNE
ncbi:MAG: DNA replication protein DnaC, partial [Ruminococcus sp.]|nr:DNA replication protein DnaC [Ruminococcus sp.]